MSVSALSKIEAAGFRVFLKGENLGIAPADTLTESQRYFLKQNKIQIIKELQSQVVWEEMPEPKPNAIMVTVYTPAGNALEVEVRSPQHAEFLQRMNPKPIIH
jgi:hypothetical protein